MEVLCSINSHKRIRITFNIFQKQFHQILFLATSVLGSHSKKKQALDCVIDCADDYKPICAKAIKGVRDRLLTFGNDCVLSHHNCQHSDDKYQIKFEGECGGNVSVRLV